MLPTAGRGTRAVPRHTGLRAQVRVGVELVRRPGEGRRRQGRVRARHLGIRLAGGAREEHRVTGLHREVIAAHAVALVTKTDG